MVSAAAASAAPAERRPDLRAPAGVVDPLERDEERRLVRMVEQASSFTDTGALRQG
jgi:hypothetical protein